MKKEVHSSPSQQQFCVRWNSHLGRLGAAFPELLAGQLFVDVTLASDGHQLHCHRLVLAACSSYFEQLLTDNPCKHPIIILPHDIRLWEIQALVDFMYKGEVNVSKDGLPSLLRCAEILQIRGLCGADAALNVQRAQQGVLESYSRISGVSPIDTSTIPKVTVPTLTQIRHTRQQIRVRSRSSSPLRVKPPITKLTEPMPESSISPSTTNSSSMSAITTETLTATISSTKPATACNSSQNNNNNNDNNTASFSSASSSQSLAQRISTPKPTTSRRKLTMSSSVGKYLQNNSSATTSSLGKRRSNSPNCSNISFKIPKTDYPQPKISSSPNKLSTKKIVQSDVDEEIMEDCDNLAVDDIKDKSVEHMSPSGRSPTSTEKNSRNDDKQNEQQLIEQTDDNKTDSDNNESMNIDKSKNVNNSNIININDNIIRVNNINKFDNIKLLIKSTTTTTNSKPLTIFASVDSARSTISSPSATSSSPAQSRSLVRSTPVLSQKLSKSSISQGSSKLLSTVSTQTPNYIEEDMVDGTKVGLVTKKDSKKGIDEKLPNTTSNTIAVTQSITPSESSISSTDPKMLQAVEKPVIESTTSATIATTSSYSSTAAANIILIDHDYEEDRSTINYNKNNNNNNNSINDSSQSNNNNQQDNKSEGYYDDDYGDDDDRRIMNDNVLTTSDEEDDDNIAKEIVVNDDGNIVNPNSDNVEYANDGYFATDMDIIEIEDDEIPVKDKSRTIVSVHDNNDTADDNCNNINNDNDNNKKTGPCPIVIDSSSDSNDSDDNDNTNENTGQIRVKSNYNLFNQHPHTSTELPTSLKYDKQAMSIVLRNVDRPSTSNDQNQEYIQQQQSQYNQYYHQQQHYEAHEYDHQQHDSDDNQEDNDYDPEQYNQHLSNIQQLHQQQPNVDVPRQLNTLNREVQLLCQHYLHHDLQHSTRDDPVPSISNIVRECPAVPFALLGDLDRQIQQLHSQMSYTRPNSPICTRTPIQMPSMCSAPLHPSLQTSCIPLYNPTVAVGNVSNYSVHDNLRGNNAALNLSVGTTPYDNISNYFTTMVGIPAPNSSYGNAMRMPVPSCMNSTNVRESVDDDDELDDEDEEDDDDHDEDDDHDQNDDQNDNDHDNNNDDVDDDDDDGDDDDDYRNINRQNINELRNDLIHLISVIEKILFDRPNCSVELIKDFYNILTIAGIADELTFGIGHIAMLPLRLVELRNIVMALSSRRLKYLKKTILNEYTKSSFYGVPEIYEILKSWIVGNPSTVSSRSGNSSSRDSTNRGDLSGVYNPERYYIVNNEGVSSGGISVAGGGTVTRSCCSGSATAGSSSFGYYSVNGSSTSNTTNDTINNSITSSANISINQHSTIINNQHTNDDYADGYQSNINQSTSETYCIPSPSQVVLRNPRSNQPRQYSNQELYSALMDVKRGESIYRASQQHKVPRKTLRNWMKRWHIKSAYPMPRQLQQAAEKKRLLKNKERHAAKNNASFESDAGLRINVDNARRRVRRSDAILRQAAECVSKGQTFQTVSDMFNIPISTLRFYMARKGILPRRKRGRSAGASTWSGSNEYFNPGAENNSRSASPLEPPFHFVNYKLPDIKPKLM